MKIYRRALYAAVAVMTLGIGLGTVKGALLASAAVWQQTDAPEVRLASERQPVVRPLTEAVGEPDLLDSDSAPSYDESAVPFDPTGDYVLDINTLPKAFSDLEYLTLEVTEFYEQKGEYLSRPIVPRGSMYGKKQFRFSRIAVAGRELAFQTRTVNGVSYRFVGRFPVWEESSADEAVPSLTGKLIKIKNGKWAAAMEAKFYLQHGC